MLQFRPSHSPGYLKALATLDSLAAKLPNIQMHIDIRREQCYEDRKELVAYINEAQHLHNEILNNLDSIWRHYRCTIVPFTLLEARVEHVNFHMHKHANYFVAPLVFPPNPPP